MANQETITVKQYITAIKKLSSSQQEILKKLYHIESAINNKFISQQLGYKGNGGGANLQIGKIGKAICQILNIVPDLSTYNPSTKEHGYFIVVHQEYLDREEWDIKPNLRKAIEALYF